MPTPPALRPRRVCLQRHTKPFEARCRLCVAVAALSLQIGVTDRAPPSDKILRVLLAHHPTHAEALGAKLGAAAQGRRSSFPAVVATANAKALRRGQVAWAGGM